MSIVDENITISLNNLLDCLSEEGLIETIINEASLKNIDLSLTRTLCVDSRKLGPEDIFLAIKGLRFDPHKHLLQIHAKNPALILVEDEAALYSEKMGELPIIKLSNARKTWAHLCARACGEPQKKLKLIGITGTNGKTSSVWHLRQQFLIHGKKILSIGTLGSYLNMEHLASTHTTPDPPVLYRLFEKALKMGIEYVVMEVSSHALFQEKLAPCRFEYSGFTSFSRDHLDLHGTLEDYFKCKFSLFYNLSSKNVRFFLCAGLDENLKAFSSVKKKNSFIYGFKAKEVSHKLGFENFAEIVSVKFSGTNTKLVIDTSFRDFPSMIEGPVFGNFACENFLLAKLVFTSIFPALNQSKTKKVPCAVPGRLEPVRIATANAQIFVDYAHTPDALLKALDSLRELLKPKARLIVVFGCGGDRDHGKRAEMAVVAQEHADLIYVTSDNPRSELPEAIIGDIMKGFSQKALAFVRAEIDRKRAIERAIYEAQPDDIVLIAGKGHEDYQEILGKKYPFDDRKIAEHVIRTKQHAT